MKHDAARRQAHARGASLDGINADPKWRRCFARPTSLVTLFALVAIAPMAAATSQGVRDQTVDPGYLAGLHWRNIGPSAPATFRR